MTERREEIILAAREATMATHVRSNVLESSLRLIREQRRFDRYAARLSPALREQLLSLSPGMWVPMELGLAHYGAANALGLTAAEQYENGRQVADRVRSTSLMLVPAIAQAAGATMWTVLSHSQRLWDRLMLGGAVAVYKIGPKEARLEGYGAPLAGVPYVLNGWRGMVAGIGELFCRKIYVHEISRRCSGTSFAFRIAWV